MVLFLLCRYLPLVNVWFVLNSVWLSRLYYRPLNLKLTLFFQTSSLSTSLLKFAHGLFHFGSVSSFFDSGCETWSNHSRFYRRCTGFRRAWVMKFGLKKRKLTSPSHSCNQNLGFVESRQESSGCSWIVVAGALDHRLYCWYWLHQRLVRYRLPLRFQLNLHWTFIQFIRYRTVDSEGASAPRNIALNTLLTNLP